MKSFDLTMSEVFNARNDLPSFLVQCGGRLPFRLTEENSVFGDFARNGSAMMR